MTFDCRFQCSRVGLEVKIYDTPAGGIRASQGTFSSINVCKYKRNVSLTKSIMPASIKLVSNLPSQNCDSFSVSGLGIRYSLLQKFVKTGMVFSIYSKCEDDTCI